MQLLNELKHRLSPIFTEVLLELKYDLLFLLFINLRILAVAIQPLTVRRTATGRVLSLAGDQSCRSGRVPRQRQQPAQHRLLDLVSATGSNGR